MAYGIAICTVPNMHILSYNCVIYIATSQLVVYMQYTVAYYWQLAVYLPQLYYIIQQYIYQLIYSNIVVATTYLHNSMGATMQIMHTISWVSSYQLFLSPLAKYIQPLLQDFLQPLLVVVMDTMTMHINPQYKHITKFYWSARLSCCLQKSIAKSLSASNGFAAKELHFSHPYRELFIEQDLTLLSIGVAVCA